MWMNESEIDETLELVAARAPEYLPYAKYLSDWRRIVNGNSDGWPYWKAGTRCASNLMELLKALVASIRDRDDSAPPIKAFDRSLTPIKACATRHKLPAPSLDEVYEDAIKDDMQFVEWVEGTLIPDLKDSGTVETARDFERLVRIIKRLTGN